MRHAEYLNTGSHRVFSWQRQQTPRRSYHQSRGSSVIKAVLSSQCKPHATRRNYTSSAATWEFLDKQPHFSSFYSKFRAHSIRLMREKLRVRSCDWNNVWFQWPKFTCASVPCSLFAQGEGLWVGGGLAGTGWGKTVLRRCVWFDLSSMAETAASPAFRETLLTVS